MCTKFASKNCLNVWIFLSEMYQISSNDAQEIDRETALQTPQNEETNRIPFTFTYHPHDLVVKNVILKNFKIIFSAMIPKLNIYFLYHHLLHSKAHSSLTTWNLQMYTHTMQNSGPNRSFKITDHFTCISANVIYCITCM